MSSKISPIVLLGLAGLIVLLIFFSSPRSLDITGVNKVNVQIGREPTQSYWIMTAILNELEEFQAVLPGGTVAQSADTQTKTVKSIAVRFTPLPPVSATSLTYVENYQFVKGRDAISVGWGGVELGPMYREIVPVYRVEGGNWITSVQYNVKLYVNDGEKTAVPVDFNVQSSYDRKRTITIPVEGKNITINNLGMLSTGVSVPTTDMMIVFDPRATGWSDWWASDFSSTKWMIWSQADLLTVLSGWESYTFGKTGSWSWSDVLNWAKAEGRLPREVQMAYVGAVTYAEQDTALQKIFLTYSGITYNGVISIYVPDSIAETITVKLFAPKPKIVTYPPVISSSLNMGQSVNFDVTVRNDGTEGDITLSVNSQFLQIFPAATMYMFKEGESHTFTFKATALEVSKDTTVSDITLLAQGRGGTDQVTMSATIQKTTHTVTSTAPPGGTSLQFPDILGALSNLFKLGDLGGITLMIMIGLAGFVIVLIIVKRRSE